jgi:quercetin dioxygenase-like cupin family protein
MNGPNFNSQPPAPESEKSFYEKCEAVSESAIEGWIKPENLANKEVIKAEGFTVTLAIDGGPDKNVEVSLVEIRSEGEYPQHVHKKSDAFFVVVSGEAYFLSGKEKTLLKQGEKVQIPRGTPHGFELEDGKSFQFISIQSPPIINEETGEQDFHLFSII